MLKISSICLVVAIYSGATAAATVTEKAILERLAQLEANQSKMEAELHKRDARIQELEQRLGAAGQWKICG